MNDWCGLLQSSVGAAITEWVQVTLGCTGRQTEQAVRKKPASGGSWLLDDGVPPVGRNKPFPSQVVPGRGVLA